MIRVLQIITSLEGAGGVQKRLVDNYKNMNRQDIHFDFVVHEFEHGELEETVQKLGSTVFHVCPKQVSLIRNIRDIHNVISKGNYDIVQCHMEHAGAIALLIAKLNNVTIRIAHGHIAHLPFSGIQKYLNPLFSFILRHVSTDYWACSEDAGEWLFGRKMNRLRVIPNAIEVENFKFSTVIRKKMRERLGIKNEFALVNVGRLSQQKNQAFLLKIVSGLMDVGLPVKLFIIGDGELRDDLVKQIAENGLSDVVQLLGTRDNVNTYLQAMDLMIHPALYEGLGNVLIESQAAGLPVVASLEGIPAETNLTKLIKYVSLNGGVNNWIKACQDMLKIDRVDMTRTIAEKGYDVKVQGLQLQELYSKLIKEGKK